MRQILHISDVHFGPPHLPEVASAVLDLVARRQPDLVVVSGDLTQRAKTEQFRQAREFVDRVQAPTITVPGNHDVPMYRFWERLLDPLGAYRRHFAAELEPEIEDDELLVLSVNTAFNWTVKGGRIRTARLGQIQRRLAAAPDHLVKIIVAHHELVPAPRFGSRRVMVNAHQAVDVFRRGGVELVLSGHLHQAWISSSEAYYPSGRRPVLLVHSGTSTSNRGRGCERQRNTCNWIRIDDDEIRVSHLGWEGTEGRFLEWSQHRFPRRRRQPYGLEAV
ncbi:MAG: metallophosphoesterase family protein [Thermoanaerobaculia bacterium]